MLAFGATIGWILALPAIGRLWGDIFTFWARHLGMKTEVLMVPQGWGNHIHFSLPCFAVAAGPATGMVWWVTAILTLLCFVGSFFLPEDVLPWMYLLRGFCLLQATALGYLALASARFPHDLPGYTVSMLVFSCILIGLVPILYGFTFYLLNFTLQQKVSSRLSRSCTCCCSCRSSTSCTSSCCINPSYLCLSFILYSAHSSISSRSSGSIPGA